MSLVVSISVNDSPALGYAVIRRTSGGDSPDSENTYEYKLYGASEPRFANLRVFAKGDIEHRYGDGAWSLLRKVLAVADV